MKISANKILIYLLSFISLSYIALVLTIATQGYSFNLDSKYTDIMLFATNIMFMLLILVLLLYIINELFSLDEESNHIIKPVLYVVSTLVVFVKVQEIDLTWEAQTLFLAVCFFALLSFLIGKLSNVISPTILIFLVFGSIFSKYFPHKSRIVSLYSCPK